MVAFVFMGFFVLRPNWSVSLFELNLVINNLCFRACAAPLKLFCMHQWRSFCGSV